MYVSVRESSFLSNPRVPLNVSASNVTVSFGGVPLNDVQARVKLAPHEATAVIIVDDPVGSFCGFADPTEEKSFQRASWRLLEYRRSPFCYEDGVRVPGYSQCCTPRKPGDAFFPCIHGFDPPEPLPLCAANAT